MALSNREKSELRGKAQALKCSVTVGKGGLTEAVREQIRHAFAGRELVKVRIQPLTQRVPSNGTDRVAIIELRSTRCVKGQHHERDEINRIAREIAESVPCDLVARTGFTATFFQPRA